jgi:hypothetical protein
VSPLRAGRDCEDRSGQRGQALYEFAILLPVFLLLLLGMLEFGSMFLQNQTLQYATREGARAGAAMANGSLTDRACVSGGGSVGATNVDPLVMDAVQRVLKSSGSQVDLSRVTNIVIFRADPTTGQDTGNHNTWTWVGSGLGASVQCQSPAVNLDFSPNGTVGWPAANRVNGAVPDSIGVSITYQYQFRTPLGGILGFFGGNSWSSLTMTDRTVMALEPTN